METRCVHHFFYPIFLKKLKRREGTISRWFKRCTNLRFAFHLENKLQSWSQTKYAYLLLHCEESQSWYPRLTNLKPTFGQSDITRYPGTIRDGDQDLRNIAFKKTATSILVYNDLDAVSAFLVTPGQLNRAYRFVRAITSTGCTTFLQQKSPPSSKNLYLI